MRRLCGFCLCLCLASCSNKYGEHPPYPVSGQVLVNGQPAKGVRVVFYHEGDWGNERTIVPQAWTEEDGQFVLETYGVKDGAPAGDYRVTVEWPAYRRGKNWGPDKLGSKYAKRETSGLTAHMEERSNKLPPFELAITAAQVKLNATVEAQWERKQSKNR
jgi:hypothetical protein